MSWHASQIKVLKRIKQLELFHVADGERIDGLPTGLSGDCAGLYGDCTGLIGDCTGLSGDCTWLSGDCTGLSGDLDAAADLDRTIMTNIEDLIMEEGETGAK